MSTPTAERIKEARRSLHLTQEEFAREVGVGLRSVPDWESGKRHPRISALRRISQVTGVSLDELVPPEPAAS